MKPTNPPVLGTVSANAVSIRPASLAVSTASLSTLSLTIAENATIPPAKTGNWAAKYPMSLLPVMKPSKPPVLGTVSANAVSILPALAAASTAAVSTRSLTMSENPTIPTPRDISCAANVVMFLPPSKNELIPLRKLAAVISNTISTMFLAADNISEFTSLTPSKNGLRFVMNCEMLVAMSGSPDITPAARPPTILPTNEPSPYPIFSSTGIAVSSHSLICGNSVTRAPMPTIKAPNATISAANTPMPINAG